MTPAALEYVLNAHKAVQIVLPGKTVYHVEVDTSYRMVGAILVPTSNTTRSVVEDV